jgi:hypothetical protein
MQQRQQHINVVTANANNKFTKQQLTSMDDCMLVNMATLAKQNNSGLNDAMLRPNFFGQQGMSTLNAAPQVEEPLTFGKLDYKAMAAGN